ncbi:MAG: acyl-CoA dehydrogenase, middle protein [uncultured bacterium]|nr:MAG: acyl-CoA dehydrogenase, middle protein [uncultured bacterium]
MNLQLSEDQKLIQASVQDYFERAQDFGVYLSQSDGSKPLHPDIWNELRDMGWLGILVPESAGGLGLGPQELMLVMEGVGESLLLEPLLSTVICTPVLAKSTSDMARSVLESTLAGKEVLALAWDEQDSSLVSPWALQATVASKDCGWRLSGKKRLVADASAATWLLVSALDADGQKGLWLVPISAPGVNVADVRMVDGRRHADVDFQSVALHEGSRILSGHAAEVALQTALYRGLAAICSQALGSMQRVLQITRTYLLERQQFGRPLADFQVLRHRIADMAMTVQRAKSMTYLAAIRADEAAHGDTNALRDLCMAKFLIGRCGREVGSQGIQLHGGMGMALEYPVGHYYRSLLAVDAAFGSSDEHLSYLADTLVSH